MKITLLLFLAFFNSSFSSPDNKVYICTTSSSYAYHKSKSCSFLQRCSKKIESTSVKDAVGVYKRKPCKPCYN